jgi:hypothetical protein
MILRDIPIDRVHLARGLVEHPRRRSAPADAPPLVKRGSRDPAKPGTELRTGVPRSLDCLEVKPCCQE